MEYKTGARFALSAAKPWWYEPWQYFAGSLPFWSWMCGADGQNGRGRFFAELSFGSPEMSLGEVAIDFTFASQFDQTVNKLDVR